MDRIFDKQFMVSLYSDTVTSKVVQVLTIGIILQNTVSEKEIKHKLVYILKDVLFHVNEAQNG